jgi:hypothetical protein
MPIERIIMNTAKPAIIYPIKAPAILRKIVISYAVLRREYHNNISLRGPLCSTFLQDDSVSIRN